MTDFISRSTTDKVMELLSVAEGTGDLLYFSSPGVLAVAGGSALTPLPNIFSSVVGIPPGGAVGGNAGEIVTEDSGLSIDMKLYDSYMGMAKKIITEMDSLAGDVSGGLSGTQVDQVNCPNSETWPSSSKIGFWVDELSNTLYLNVKYSDGSSYYTTLLLNPSL